MTNRQWMLWQIIDVSDEELIKYFGCEACRKYVMRNKPCPSNCPDDCDSLFLAWLKQEHKEES